MLARVIDASPDFQPREWLSELPPLDAFGTLVFQVIGQQLTAIPGIGPWTVQGFLIVALNRPDVVLPGDLALRKSIRRVYALGHLPTPAEVLQLAERWRPYRSLATAYLFQAAHVSNAHPTPVQEYHDDRTMATRFPG